MRTDQCTRSCQSAATVCAILGFVTPAHAISHRAATTGSTGFISLLLNPPEGSPKPRLNTADRAGNTPLHLAIESGHAQAAVMLIEAGADRSRVRVFAESLVTLTTLPQTNLEDQYPEQLEGVGGQEQRRVREYIVDRCGPAPQ